MTNPATLIRNAVRRLRGKGFDQDEAEEVVSGEAVTPGLQAWHTYENPDNGDRMRIFNASEQAMPLEMLVNGRKWAHIHPFSGEPSRDNDHERTGAFIFRPLTVQERNVLVGIRLKEAKKRMRASGFTSKPDHELKHMYHIEIAKECAVVQLT